MKNVLEELFDNYNSKKRDSDLIIKLESEIEKNKHQLKKNIDKKQKKLLLRIEDGKIAINEAENAENFNAGFKTGLKLGFEIFEIDED